MRENIDSESSTDPHNGTQIREKNPVKNRLIVLSSLRSSLAWYNNLSACADFPARDCEPVLYPNKKE